MKIDTLTLYTETVLALLHNHSLSFMLPPPFLSHTHIVNAATLILCLKQNYTVCYGDSHSRDNTSFDETLFNTLCFGENVRVCASMLISCQVHELR